MRLIEFNSLDPVQAKNELLKCCGCAFWVNHLMKGFPFSSIDNLKQLSDAAWTKCNKDDIFEAFSHHPKIGQKKLEQKFESTKSWAENEQSGTRNADEKILDELEEANLAYQKKFGYIYIVCATGKSAKEMLSILHSRLNNDAEKELKIAAAEQNKITHLRIDKLLS